jgi:D-alanyl-D-alanine carboxypeptidase
MHPTTTTMATTTTTSPYTRPDWLGTRLLPLRPDEFGVVQPTPPEMQDRQFETLDLLPPPSDEVFHSTIEPIPPDVLARSSWVPECPVTPEELSYLTMAHFGFDQRFHTGEMIVNAAVAEQVVEIFRHLHEARFPIEQMRVITKEEIDAHPTGDWNDTTSFVCRPAVSSTAWSQHAYGTGIDINPFHNPYLKGDLVLPELASAYVDRDNVRVGMIVPGDVATEAFAEIGWGWGGNWSSLKDWMHFSLSGG